MKFVALKTDKGIYIGYQSDEMTNGRCAVLSSDKSGCSVLATVIISIQKEIGLLNCRDTEILWSGSINL